MLSNVTGIGADGKNRAFGLKILISLERLMLKLKLQYFGHLK